jgi:hypothetical protein
LGLLSSLSGLDLSLELGLLRLRLSEDLSLELLLKDHLT